MDKKSRDVKKYATNNKKRTAIAMAAIAVVAGIATFITKRGKAKP